ncbi:MAG: hypothetical protein RLZZ502_1883 [Pseudomonadota bacterium]|jgi:twitching motility protein PilI
MSKQSLSEFQQNLAQKLIQARSSVSLSQWLAFSAGKRHFLIPLSEVGEVVPISHITTIPMTHAWFSGLANIRGAVVAVTDLHTLMQDSMGQTPAYLGPNSPNARLLSLGGEYANLRAALKVDQVFGLRQPKDWIPSQELAFCHRYSVDAEQTRWHELNVNAVLTQSAFFDIQEY